jgi:hypothetical protein
MEEITAPTLARTRNIREVVGGPGGDQDSARCHGGPGGESKGEALSDLDDLTTNDLDAVALDLCSPGREQVCGRHPIPR